MGIYSKGMEAGLIGSPAVIGIVARDFLGSVGGFIAVLGVIVLPITSGDTALRSVRLMLGDALNYDQGVKKNRLILAAGIFVPVILILVFAKMNPKGFNVLWRYFALANQAVAVFAFAMIAVYLYRHKKPYWMALIPGAFYMYVTSSYILNAKIGFNLSSTIANGLGIALAFVFAYFIINIGKRSPDTL